MKTYRRFIRMGNSVKASPKFKRKSDAEDWYQEMLKKKHFEKSSLEFVSKNPSMTMIEYSRVWLDEREKHYPKSTTASDEQRLRDYILPIFAQKPLNRITVQDVQKFFKKVSSEGYRAKGFTISDKTLNKVKVLLSTIFNDALNEDPPIVLKNPVFGLKLRPKKRLGKKKPVFIKSSEDVLSFLTAAKEIGGDTFLLASLALMSGLRKQEMIALRWECLDLENRVLEIKEKYQQASKTIVDGTKGGTEETRLVPIPNELIEILIKHRQVSKYKEPHDFVLARAGGRHYQARAVNYLIEHVRTRSNVFSTVHGLRHTYGREFVLKTGNQKALQAILGHASSSTTDLYSDISGTRIRGFGESVSYDISVKKKGS